MKISVVGCGWLGLPLAVSLVQKGHTVLGSTTSNEKLKTLESAGIAPYLLKFDPMPVGEKFNQLFKTECLIINIPPGRKTNTPQHFEEQIKYLKYLTIQHQIPKVIFVSSTSYYPNTNDWVDEDSPYDLLNGSSKAIVQGEKQIRQIDSELLVLRCAGLMGENRIPGKWFSGRPTTGANTLVNYIHRNDVIGLILDQLNKKQFSFDTINAVCPEHPSRKSVHEAMSIKYEFAPPIWQTPLLTDSKMVRGERLKTIGYNFIHSSPLEF